MTDVDALTILDIGGGDLQKTDININPYGMTTQHLGAGTIGIARALKARFPRMNLSDVAAQQALVTRKLRISGRNQDISKRCRRGDRNQWAGSTQPDAPDPPTTITFCANDRWRYQSCSTTM